jgi:hypothetical protein
MGQSREVEGIHDVVAPASQDAAQTRILGYNYEEYHQYLQSLEVANPYESRDDLAMARQIPV